MRLSTSCARRNTRNAALLEEKWKLQAFQLTSQIDWSCDVDQRLHWNQPVWAASALLGLNRELILSDWSLLSRVINITEQILLTNGLCIVKKQFVKWRKGIAKIDGLCYVFFMASFVDNACLGLICTTASATSAQTAWCPLDRCRHVNVDICKLTKQIK